jgi:hypothetical protein
LTAPSTANVGRLVRVDLEELRERLAVEIPSAQ